MQSQMKHTEYTDKMNNMQVEEYIPRESTTTT